MSDIPTKMTGKRANAIINRLLRSGMTREEIAVRIDCTVDATYRWKRNPQQRVGARFSARLRQLDRELKTQAQKEN